MHTNKMPLPFFIRIFNRLYECTRWQTMCIFLFVIHLFMWKFPNVSICDSKSHFSHSFLVYKKPTFRMHHLFNEWVLVAILEQTNIRCQGWASSEENKMEFIRLCDFQIENEMWAVFELIRWTELNKVCFFNVKMVQ